MIMLHRVLASFSSDMLRILLALYFVNLINCQQDYGDSPQPYQAHKVYHHKPPPPPPKPYQAPKVYHQSSRPQQESPKPYQAPSHHHVYHHWEAPQPYEDSSYGGLTKPQGAPHAYGDNYLAPIMKGPGGGISHRFQKPSSIWQLVQPMTAFWSRMPEPARPLVEPRCEAMYDCLAWPFMECMVRNMNTRRCILNMVFPTNYAEKAFSESKVSLNV